MARNSFGRWWSPCYECGCLLMLVGPGQLPVCPACQERAWVSFERLVRELWEGGLPLRLSFRPEALKAKRL